MSKTIPFGLLMAALSLPALADFDLAQLMSELAKHKGGKARFVETRHISLLDKPVVSSGEMSYTASPKPCCLRKTP